MAGRGAGRQLSGPWRRHPVTDVRALRGTPVTEAEVRTVRFVPLELRFADEPVPLATVLGCSWTREGDVPDGPGL